MTKGLYPIRTISAMTGVNPVTLRAWERRYGLIQPQRTPKGHRLYTEQDLERIQQILMLLERGIPISQAKSVLEGREAGIEETSSPDVATHSGWHALRREWEAALRSADDHRLEQAHASALGLFPADCVLRELALPLLDELQQAEADNAAAAFQFRFLRSFLRNKLAARLHHQGAYASGPRLLLAAPIGSCDDLPLLLLATAAQRHGYRCVLLGGDVPLHALKHAMDAGSCTGLVLTGSTATPPDGLMQHLEAAELPVFLLDGAASWADHGGAQHFIPVPRVDAALDIIGRSIPPMSGGMPLQGFA